MTYEQRMQRSKDARASYREANHQRELSLGEIVESSVAETPPRPKRADVTVEILGRERDIVVYYSYFPGEPETRDEPGCDEEWDLCYVLAEIGGVTIDLLDAGELSDYDVDNIIDAVKSC